MPGKAVLIVDDDPAIRDAVRIICELEDLDVVGEASDGKEAIEFVEDSHPDFIILDYMMPNMNGELAAGVIRVLSPSSRIVAFSAILEEKPPWADAFIAKNNINDLPKLLATLG